jgi:hypothetical protein
LIALANSMNPSSAVSTLSAAFLDPTSFAHSSPTFEALNRVTLAYALIRTGEMSLARLELDKVGEMIERDGGQTQYFAKIRERAKHVISRRNVGVIKGINDKAYESPSYSPSELLPPSKGEPS